MPRSELPNWPRLLRVDLACAYVGMSKSAFLDAVKKGRWPKPVRQGKITAWDRETLDKWVDDLREDTPTATEEDWENVAKAAVRR